MRKFFALKYFLCFLPTLLLFHSQRRGVSKPTLNFILQNTIKMNKDIIYLNQMRRKNLGITERQSYKMEMAKKKTVRIGKY